MLKLHRSPDYQYFLLVIKVVTGTLRLVYVTDKLINNLQKKRLIGHFFPHLWVMKGLQRPASIHCS